MKQFRRSASDAVIQVLQRGAKAEDAGEGSVPPGRPQGVLLGYRRTVEIRAPLPPALLAPLPTPK